MTHWEFRWPTIILTRLTRELAVKVQVKPVVIVLSSLFTETLGFHSVFHRLWLLLPSVLFSTVEVASRKIWLKILSTASKFSLGQDV